MRKTLTVLCSILAAAFKTSGNIILFNASILFKKIDFVLCKVSSTEPYSHKGF